MADKPAKPRKPKKRVRADGQPDRRGGGTAHPGKPLRPGGNPGRIGNAPFVPTDEQRAKVRSLAQAFPDHKGHEIAAQMGISRATLYRHFADEMVMGRSSMLAAVASQVIQRALKGDDATDAEGKKLAPGNLDAQKFILARLGGWTTKVEMTGKEGRPIEMVDLSRLNDKQLQEYGRLAAIAEGKDPEEVVGRDDA